MLESGIKLHHEGRLIEAEKIYKKILAGNPNHFDSLYLSSEIAIQWQKFDLAKNLLTRAAKQNPSHGNTQFNLAVVFEKLGDTTSAIKHYTIAISLNPKNVEALYNRAVALAKKGELDESLKDLNKVLDITPELTIALESKNEILKILSLNPSQIETISPKYNDNFIALHDAGLNYLQIGKYAQAIDCFDKAILIHPNRAEAHHNKGMALEKIGEFNSALQCYKLAILYDKDSAATHNNLGNTLRELNCPNDAINAFETALMIRPNYAEALNNMGWTHYIMRNFSKARECYQQAIAQEPALSAAYFNLSLCDLMQGNLIAGWENYEYRRFQTISKSNYSDDLYWLGKTSLANKSIYVYFEQGLGDTIQFCRYIKLLADVGAKVFFRPQPELLTLLANLEGVTEFISTDVDRSQFDFHCSLMSLPHAFKTDLTSIPRNIPYLEANNSKISYWKDRLSNIAGPKVGLIWSGGFRSQQPELWGVNNRRNIPFNQIAEINTPGINFISLQKGDRAEDELVKLRPKFWPTNNFYNFSNDLSDFSDTAALVANLDLVISVDTSTAHLAAAMGKPVWILNRFDNCWRWFSTGNQSPWYPTLRLYRQQISGEWSDVIAMVKKDLVDFLSK